LAVFHDLMEWNREALEECEEIGEKCLRKSIFFG